MLSKPHYCEVSHYNECIKLFEIKDKSTHMKNKSERRQSLAYTTKYFYDIFMLLLK